MRRKGKSVVVEGKVSLTLPSPPPFLRQPFVVLSSSTAEGDTTTYTSEGRDMDKTFQNWHSDAIGFPSTWKRNKKYAESSVQTQEIKFEDKNVQSSSVSNIATQTDKNGGGDDVDVEKLSAEPYPPSLYAFFAKVTDVMCKNLEDNSDPFASEVFKDTGEDETSEGQLEAKCLFTLRNENVPSQFGGRCVAWNCTGSQVAVGYSAYSHEGWCCHRIPLSVWNLRRSFNFNPTVPHVQMYLSSCVSSMEFHPVNPSVIAVGLHCGEVALIDIFVNESKDSTEKPSEEEGLLGQGKVDQFKMTDLGFFVDGSGHVSEITGVKWLKFSQSQVNELVSKNKNPSMTCLLTCGKDGYICLWSVNHTTTRLYLEKKFIAWSDNISDDIRIGNRIYLKMKEIGVVGISSCKDDPMSFMCTTYGGYVFQGTLDGEVEAYTAMLELNEPDAINPETLFDPRLVLMNKFGGNPKFIDCSPYHRNVFLSGTTNGDLFVHNLLKPMKPVIELYLETSLSGSLNDARWSWRPSMFGVAVENHIKIFDLKSGNAPVLEIGHDNDVMSLSFNKIELGQIAVCDELGSIHIWQLPAVLSSHEPDELDILLRLTSFSDPSAEIFGSTVDTDKLPQQIEES